MMQLFKGELFGLVCGVLPWCDLAVFGEFVECPYFLVVVGCQVSVWPVFVGGVQWHESTELLEPVSLGVFYSADDVGWHDPGCVSGGVVVFDGFNAVGVGVVGQEFLPGVDGLCSLFVAEAVAEVGVVDGDVSDELSGFCEVHAVQPFCSA